MKIKKRTSQQLPNALYRKLIGSCERFDRKGFLKRPLILPIDLYAQYREIVISGKVRCHVRTTRELVEELRRAEFEDDFVSPVIAAASRRAPYHLFWDDIDKLKLTDFKTEVLFDVVDSLYRQKHGMTITGNYSMRDLIERERMHPAIVRRLDDMCCVVEV